MAGRFVRSAQGVGVIRFGVGVGEWPVAFVRVV
jgi:hypothetical protein